jgi:hypothetical protein
VTLEFRDVDGEPHNTELYARSRTFQGADVIQKMVIRYES